jgi:DNA-binding response OmpR family regulator
MSPTQPRRHSILVVDDQPANINMLGAALSREFGVSVATNGHDALRIASGDPLPDLILLDIVMPEMDGYEVCQALKDDDRTRDIPVIFITAMSEEEDETKGLELGAVDYITKPFRVPIVQARVRAVLKLKEEMDKRQELTRRLQETNRELEAANHRVMQSIEYAQGIQRAFLPQQENIDRHIHDHFVIWSPKDIIGGDIFWFEGRDEGFWWAIMDCTGHGVPGAIMTMIAGTSLDRVINDFKCTEPARALQELNRLIRNALDCRRTSPLADDGLDIGLCRLERDKNRLIFAGARISMFHIHPGKDDELHEIKGDRMSVGYRSSDADFEFTNHYLELQPGMRFYLTTDGYLDQLGGRKRFSFGKRRFGAFVTEHAHRPFAEQKELLKREFEAYRHDEPQVDDVTVIGFEIRHGE